jgi:hypothetical protein
MLFVLLMNRQKSPSENYWIGARLAKYLQLSLNFLNTLTNGYHFNRLIAFVVR